MDLVQFDPFSIWRDLEHVFDRGPRASAWLPRIDVFDRDESLVVRVEVPGLTPDDIDITLEDRTLTIAGDRSFESEDETPGYHRREIQVGRFVRTIVLPEGLDPDGITARSEAGILEVSIPRRPEVLPRKVKVDVAAS